MKKRILKNIFRGLICAPFLMMLMYNFYLVTIHLKKAPLGEWFVVLFYLIAIVMTSYMLHKKEETNND